MKVAFFGSDAFSRTCLTSLLKRCINLDVTLVFAKHNFAPTLNLPTINNWKTTSYTQFTVGLVASFGAFIPLRLMRQFRTGTILNVHPSLLPSYRGAAPIQWTLLDKCSTTGVTVIDCDAPTFDAGSIWAQKSVDVKEEDCYESLSSRLAELGGVMLADVLLDFGQREKYPQVGPVSIARKITRADALITWSSMSSSAVFARYRAIAHQETLYCDVDNRRLSLHMIHPELSRPLTEDVLLDRPKRVLHFRCADGMSAPVSLFGLSGKSNRFIAFDIWSNLFISDKRPTFDTYQGPLR